MTYSLALIPLLSSFIGWFPIWITIQLLFYPKKPKKIAGFTLQGILPGKQRQFAEKLGKLAATELASFREIEQKITNPAQVQKIMPLVEEHIDHFLRKKLAQEMPMISMFIGDKTINQLKAVLMAELETLFPQMIQNYMQHLQQDLDLEKIIADKIAGISPDKLEQLFNSSLLKTARLAGIMGGVFGFLIGLLQVLLLTVLR